MEEDLKPEFECAVCLEAPTDPRKLKCDHIFCRGCLEGVATPRGVIKCPLCRRITLSHPEELPLCQSVPRFAENLRQKE